MRATDAPAFSGSLFLTILVFASMAVGLPQQVRGQITPAAGTAVSVKMIDSVNSASDPAGKHYRASVTQSVDAGNGAMIAQGSSATVTLTSSGSGYAAQLSSVTINGQAIAVTSNSASVTSASQNAAASAANSVLSSLGHHISAPASVAAAATGQHISLPTGTTLTFVLNGSPAAAQSQTASAAPAPNPVSSSPATGGGGGSLTALYICFSNPPPFPSDPHYKSEYLTAAFEVPVETEGPIPAIEPAFSSYLKTTYQYPSAGITCQPIWSIADARTAQKKITSDRDTAKLKMIDTGWRYGQPPVTQGQSGFDPLAQGSGGLDLSQHRLTTYFCTLDAPGGTSITAPNPYNAQIATRYISQIFHADWDSAAVDRAYDVYIRDQYVHDLSLSDLSTRCGGQSPAFAAMAHQSALVGTKLIRHIVPVDFTDSPAQAAAAPATTASAPATGGYFISCSTSGGAGIDTYYTGVFPIKNATMTPRGVLASPESQTVLNDFYAYLKQKGYTFKPGSSSGCDIARTEATAQAAQHKRAYEGGGCSTCGKVVETGWKE